MAIDINGIRQTIANGRGVSLEEVEMCKTENCPLPASFDQLDAGGRVCAVCYHKWLEDGQIDTPLEALTPEQRTIITLIESDDRLRELEDKILDAAQNIEFDDSSDLFKALLELRKTRRPTRKELEEFMQGGT